MSLNPEEWDVEFTFLKLYFCFNENKADVETES